MFTGCIRWFFRHKLLASLSVVLLVAAVVGVAVPGCYVARGTMTGKYEGSGAEATPARRAGALVPEQQTEGHTCGMHALRAAYRGYGLEPDEFDLRFRLGVDTAAVPGDGTSTGTLPPDLLRVLPQDGFAYTLLPLEDAGAEAQLKRHLRRGQVALALVEVTGLHWVALDAAPGDRLRVVDSLSPQPYDVATPQFLGDQALSVVLIEPAAVGRSGVA